MKATLCFILVLAITTSGYTVDLIANREQIEAEGGNYGFVVARNEATIIIKGDVHLTGQMSVTGNSSIIINNGSITGATQIAVDASSTLTMAGNISAETVSIAGMLKLNDGELVIEADTFILEEGATLNANGVGENTQGQGSNTNATGGSYGGKGGADYQGGDVKKPYGNPRSLSIEEGSTGGRRPDGNNTSGGKGGGKVQITADSISVSGTITTNGASGAGRCGGGSGGGILLHSKYNLELTGSITADGGNGGFNSGGGGGGRIKTFYHTDTIVDSAIISVSGGSHGHEDTVGAKNGSPGTIFCNIAPEPTTIVKPEDKASVSNQPTFRFSVVDLSETVDTRTQIPGADGGHLDELSCRIELSQDDFQTIPYSFDQDVSLSGWSNISYTNGDTAGFTPTEALPNGTYQWRVTTFDGWLHSHPSEVRTFTVGKFSRTLQKVSGDNQSGIIGTKLLEPLVVLVKDQYDNPISGVQVDFSVTQGDSSINPTKATTNEDGQAQTILTLDIQPGDYNITASGEGLTPVVFTATAIQNIVYQIELSHDLIPTI